MKSKKLVALLIMIFFATGCDYEVGVHNCEGVEEKVLDYTKICEPETVLGWSSCSQMAKTLYCKMETKTRHIP